MVQSWVLSSNTSSSGSVRSGASFNKTRAAASAKPVHGWKLARIIFFAVAFIILFAGFSLMRTFASEQHVQPASSTEQVIYVDTGDTLWTLAATVKKDSMDIRDAVHQLKKRNGLTSSSLDSGQVLIVPDSVLP